MGRRPDFGGPASPRFVADAWRFCAGDARLKASGPFMCKAGRRRGMGRPVYLDYNATTPTDPRVLEAMWPYFLEEFGNAGSRTHPYGQRARDAVSLARGQVADLLAARPEEIVFTSGATESNNAVLLGLARAGVERGRRHVLASAI